MLSLITATRCKCTIKFSHLNVAFLPARHFIPKIQSDFKKPLMEKIFRQPTPQDLEKSKLIPEGYKVVYINKLTSYINFGHLMVFTIVIAATWNLSGYFTDPDWLNKEKTWGKMNPYIGLLLLSYGMFLNFMLVKNVRIIFRKGNQFKYMYYGSLGPLKKKYVDYNAHECVPPAGKYNILYTLKGRKIWFEKHNFFDSKDFYDMIKTETDDHY